MLINNFLSYSSWFYLLIFWTLVNLLAFLIMFNDKLKASNLNSERISEGLLFFLAAVFGALGIYIGMFIFRHKTQKWYFLLGIPLLIIENIATIYIVYLFLSGRLSLNI